VRVFRLAANPIIGPAAWDRIGPNICGPSVIRIPDWVANPLGRYYLYFAAHLGDYIRLAVADHPEGPWSVYEPGTLRLQESCFIDHIASPDVHVDHEHRQIRMYFHGMLTRVGYRQGTRVATSSNGIDFDVRPEVIAPAYLRAFRLKGSWYAIAMPGRFYRSCDGLTPFECGPQLFFENMRHPAIIRDQNTLTVVYTRIGDCPESISLTEIQLHPEWNHWSASASRSILEPEMTYEGADLPLEPSKLGPATTRVRQLRDPFIYREAGRSWLYYATAGESGIAVAQIHESDPRDSTVSQRHELGFAPRSPRN